MQHIITENLDVLCIALHGRFTFSDNQLFSPHTAAIKSGQYSKVEVLLMGLEYIDSSGLGALLMLRDVCLEGNVPLVLSHPTGQVANVFAISRFSELFNIEQ